MLEKGLDRVTSEACFREKPDEGVERAAAAAGGDGKKESSPEHHAALQGVTVDSGNDSALGPSRKERAHSSTSTCSAATADRSGVSTATGDGDAPIAALCLSPSNSCSFCGGRDQAAGVNEENTTCSVAAVLKRQALLSVLDFQRTLQPDAAHLQTPAKTVLHCVGERTGHLVLCVLFGLPLLKLNN